MTTKFCAYHFGKGCNQGDKCMFSHSPTIPRIPRPCRGCEAPKLCPFLHDGETWSQGMRPRIHPSAMVPYLEKELAAAKEEAEDLRKKLEVAKEELDILRDHNFGARKALELKQGELEATRQDLDHMTLETLEAEIKATTDSQWRTWS